MGKKNKGTVWFRCTVNAVHLVWKARKIFGTQEEFNALVTYTKKAKLILHQYRMQESLFGCREIMCYGWRFVLRKVWNSLRS